MSEIDKDSCPACGALPCDWVNDPFKQGEHEKWMMLLGGLANTSTPAAPPDQIEAGRKFMADNKQAMEGLAAPVGDAAGDLDKTFSEGGFDPERIQQWKKEFEAEQLFKFMDFTRDTDLWGREKYKHSHVDAYWIGYLTAKNSATTGHLRAGKEGTALPDGYDVLRHGPRL